MEPLRLGRSAHEIESTRAWWVVRGAAELVLGAVALAMPFVATIATTWVLAVLLAVAAGFRLAHAFRVRRWSGFFAELLLAVLYVAAAVSTFLFPVASAAVLTLVLGAWCLSVGVVEAVAAVGTRPPRWGWLVAAGVANVALGAMLVRGWPATSVWAIGLLVGVTLVVNGISSIAVGSAPRPALLPPPLPL